MTITLGRGKNSLIKAFRNVWHFQWFIPDYQVGKAYGFVMRAAYLPYQSREQVERDTLRHRAALNR